MAHEHDKSDVQDLDSHFIINGDTRMISNSAHKSVLVQFDHNSERFTFEMPRYIEGHDMSLSNLVQIHYINIGGAQRNADIYQVDDLAIKSDDSNTIEFTWLVANSATQLAGTLSFVIRFACTVDGEIAYIWNTEIYKDVIISNGIDNTGSIVSEYGDILQEWYNNIISASDSGVAKIEAAANEAVEYINGTFKIELTKSGSAETTSGVEFSITDASTFGTITVTSEVTGSTPSADTSTLLEMTVYDIVLSDGTTVTSEGVIEDGKNILKMSNPAETYKIIVRISLPSVRVNYTATAVWDKKVTPPTLDVEEIAGGHKVTMTDSIGSKSFNVMDGATGPSGVYVGSSEPTDPNVRVWIDTDGTADDSTVHSIQAAVEGIV